VSSDLTSFLFLSDKKITENNEKTRKESGWESEESERIISLSLGVSPETLDVMTEFSHVARAFRYPFLTLPFSYTDLRYSTNGVVLSSRKERGVCVTSSPPRSHERVGRVILAWLQDLRALIGLAIGGILIKMAVYHSRGVS